MNNSTIAWKTRARPSAVSLRSAVLDDFMVKMFHGFPKPQNKFIRDMVYGIQATGDTIITDIARAGMGRAVVPRRRIARGRAKRRGVLRVRKPGAASVGETCARNQRFCRGRAG